jgi:acetyltransferase
VYNLQQVSASEARTLLNDLVELLTDSVESGASVGFLLPLSNHTIESYWHEVLQQIESRHRVLLIARDDKHIVGAVQLELASKPNALHRAEVQKLLVHTRNRNHGIAKMLMSEIEDIAHKLNRTLLVLDTLQGSDAEKLYGKWGYTRLGSIPNYARISDNTLQPTVVFYKVLDSKHN